ncbi:hypothetical protein [Pelagimonas varians]|uniref:Uncharacterized protein n=1 Tax=Pelagimonas varians TaxID=696760 RepID=A0A238KF06_9RHOB|nr:hypothetical protein [Pelagimonas varians]PYG32405.1 hypothetical protein C8N36_103154 [Pelagimonas varians]SMX41433.1 hypothetical protein PEV8663_02276 [Pelagimonas varians]
MKFWIEVVRRALSWWVSLVGIVALFLSWIASATSKDGYITLFQTEVVESSIWSLVFLVCGVIFFLRCLFVISKIHKEQNSDISSLRQELASPKRANMRDLANSATNFLNASEKIYHQWMNSDQGGRETLYAGYYSLREEVNRSNSRYAHIEKVRIAGSDLVNACDILVDEVKGDNPDHRLLQASLRKHKEFLQIVDPQ